uniref:tRNA selenocysteine 1-associated protein 1 C-terminal domain-containing protein n=1 Tax=Plectus sambesii TaxID=2011161 RepID=A0A914UYT6_9BILA
MNKFKVRGKEIILKLAQPKYRAPRGAKQAVPQYDPVGYYPQYQDFYNSAAWQMYDFQQNPPHLQQPMSGPPPGAAVSSSHAGSSDVRLEDERHRESSRVASAAVDPEMELEAYNDGGMSVDEANSAFMMRSEDLYSALEESKWTAKPLIASTTQADLLDTAA